MALSSTVLSGLMLGQLASKGLFGIDTPKFCQAFSDALVTSFIAANQVTTNDVGVMTQGVGIGKMIGLVPVTLSGLTFGYCVASGLIGTGTQPLCEAVANAVCLHFLAMNIVNTTHTNVALGTGVGTVSGIVPEVMSAVMLAKLSSSGITGTEMKKFTDAFAKGFSNHITSASIVNVVIMGVPAPLVLGAPIPSTGVGIGKVT